MNSIFDSSPRATLRSLYWLRWCLLAAALAALALAWGGYLLAVPVLYPVLGLLLGGNLYTRHRLRQQSDVTPAEVFIHLMLDALLLTVMLYGSGGAANPFVSLYLLPVAFGAVTLSPMLSWGLLAGCGALYSLLIWRLLGEHASHDSSFVMHMLGMWVNYWIAAVLIVVFVGALARRLRQRDEALANARAAQLRNEQVVALGAVAAATVHELGGPLSSIDMLAESLLQEPGISTSGQEDLQLLREQLALCRTQLDELLQDTGHSSAGNWADFLAHAVERFRALRPEVRVDLNVHPDMASQPCARPEGLLLWLWGLLNNAADASLDNNSNRISLAACLDQEAPRIEVADAGTGLDAGLAPGLQRQSSKGGSRGWGLLLGHAGIEAVGGRLEFLPALPAGTRAVVTLPAS